MPSPAPGPGWTATLTGTALRSAEHTHRTSVTAADTDIAEWEDEMALAEAGIGKRSEARHLRGIAQASWQARCARYPIDGAARA